MGGLDPSRVLPSTTEPFPRPAKRPANSMMRPASSRCRMMSCAPDPQLKGVTIFEPTLFGDDRRGSYERFDEGCSPGRAAVSPSYETITSSKKGVLRPNHDQLRQTRAFGRIGEPL